MSQATSSLPLPDHHSLIHAAAMQKYLLGQIHNSPHQRITFADYMQAVLYAPNLGYYATAKQKFGHAGDFITAPELSPLFSQTLALQIKQILSQLPEADILEFGAGSGVMALNIMQKLASEQTLPKTYYILEVSAALQAEQQRLIKTKAPELFAKFQWLKTLPANPMTGVILANEVLDAMPFHRFWLDGADMQEYFVTEQENGFAWQLAEMSSANLLAKIKKLNLNQYAQYSSEISLVQPAWINSVAARLQQGVILLIDYGYPQTEYYHPERNQGTLKCFFQQHQHEDPLILSGIQDITAHVNFTAIAEAAVTAGLSVMDFTTQASFLLNSGIEKLLADIEDEISYVNAVQQLKKLTLPTEMGELFKVMALSRKIDFPLLGFKEFSRLHYL